MNVIRHLHKRQAQQEVCSLTPFMLAILAIASLTSCSSVCWKADANKTCPSILNGFNE